MALQFYAGQVLTADDLMGIQPEIYEQGTDQSVTSSTAVVDSSIVVPVLAGARYRFLMHLSYGSSSAGGLRVDWDGPSGTEMGRYIQAVASTSYTADSARMVTRTRAIGTDQTVGGGLTFAYYQEVGDVRVGGTSGNMRLRFAQAVSDATETILRADSHVIVQRIA